MTRPVVVLALFLIMFGESMAVAPSEDEIRSVSVKYSNGSEISLDCKRLECTVHILFGRKKFVFTPEDLKGFPLPSNPILYSVSTNVSEFSFELEHYCAESNFHVSQEGSKGRCMVTYDIRNGQIVGRDKFFMDRGTRIPVVQN
jgi:hypothetical protein